AAKVDNYKAAAKAYNDKLAGSETLNQAKKAYIDASAEAAKLTDKDAQKQALTNARNAYMEDLRKDSVFAGKGYSDAELQWIINYAEVENSTAYGWSKYELLYAIQDSVLNAAPGQVLTVDKANVQGKNISLSAGKNIGIDGEATNIAYNEMGKLDNLKLLAQAKAGDLTWNDTDNRIEVRQQRQITVKLADGGKLNLQANTSNTANTGNVYLAGVKDTMLDISGTINTTQDVKLLSDKGVRMNDGSIVANNLIIQGGNGDVGSKDAFIKTNISGNLEANTDTGHGVYLHQTAVGNKPAQVLTIQDAATGTLVLKADNGMQMTTEAGKNTGYLNANSINLQAANGDIGKADDGIRILENGAVINAKAENGSVYLQGAGTKDAGLVVDSITAKGNAKLNLDGDVNFGNGATSGSISAGGDVTVNGNNVNLNAGTVTAGGASNINAGKDVNVTTGSITSTGAGNITASNDVNLNSSTLAAGADSVITATNGNIALGTGSITVNGANNGLTLDANGSVMQDAAAAGITTDNLTVESGKTQQLLSQQNKVKSLTIKGKGTDSSLLVDGVTRFNGTTDNLLVTVDDSHIKGDVLIENYQADTGKITINSDIDTSKYNDEHTGNITVKADGDITTAGGVDLNAADKVSINSKKGSVATGGNVTANNEVDIDAAKDITASGNLTSTNANVDLLAGGSITTQGKVNALNNVIANANGDISTNGDVTATNGNAVLNSSAGSVTTKNVTAGQAVDIDAAKDITADGYLNAKNGDITLDAGGSITTNSTVNAHDDVIANANGNINTNGDVTATNGNAVLNSSTGSVNTQNVTAGQVVDIDAANNITASGNLTSTNANVDLNAGGSITTSGQVKAQQNVDYNAKGSITTEDIINSTAGNIHLQTDAAEGNITFGGDVTAEHGNINIDVLQNGSVTDHDNKDNKFTALGDKGDINSGNFALHIKGAGDVDLHEIYATNDARIDVAKGSLKLAKINGDLVALQLRTEGEKLQVDELIAGTKIIAQGSDIDLNKIQQRLDADGLLTIIPDGAQLNKPIDNLKIGEIITNKGVRFEHLWLNNGSIKVSEGMFHIDKLVVNNVAHFSNKHMKTAVWGAPPQRDGSDSVYWNNIAVNNPAQNLTEWQQEGTNPDKWMYLHFTAQPNVQHSNGALLDLRNYDYVYDQRFTAVDHMLQQLNENKAEEYDINHAPDVVQYF
ncbi:beta strand repeat-containing protein, partial [Phascolarctobacterium succinatutens]